MFAKPGSLLIAAAALLIHPTRAELRTVTTHISACSTRAVATCAPSHFADHCGFDARRDASIGFVDLADPNVRQRYYPSNSNQWLTDDMPYQVTSKVHHTKRWFGSGIWNDITSGVSTAVNAVGDAATAVGHAAEAGWDAASTWVSNNGVKTAVGAIASSVLKGAGSAVWNAAKGLWNAPSNIAHDVVSAVQNPEAALESIENSASTTLADFTKAVINPGEAIADVSSWFETEGVEGATEALIGGALDVAEAVVRRDATGNGTNCGSEGCEGAVFNNIDSFDGAVSLVHTLDGNIHSFNVSDLEAKLLAAGRSELAALLTDGSTLFSGIEHHLLGDARGRVLHGYADELAMHNVSRLRFSDINALPRTADLMQLIPVRHPEGGKSRIAAVDAKGHGYHLITCTYPKTLPRVFIGTDMALGPLALVGAAVKGMVQHQTPNWCSTVPYTTGEEGATAA